MDKLNSKTWSCFQPFKEVLALDMSGLQLPDPELTKQTILAYYQL